MRSAILLGLVAVVMLGAAAPATAQAHVGYVFAGALRSDSGDGFTTGFGGERIARWGVSVGGDAAWFRFGDDRAFTNDRVLTGALHVGYYVGRTSGDATWNAFVSFGPAFVAAVGVGGGLSVGYGANIWIARHAGIRGEIRTIRPVGTDLQALSSWRIGLTLR